MTNIEISTSLEAGASTNSAISGDTTYALPGVHPDIAAERGYRRLDTEDAGELHALGFADYQAALGLGLLVPMYDVTGANGSYQFRPDLPRIHKDTGKPVKYETPQGARNMLDVHPRMQPYLGDPQYTLFLTEGVKKGDSLTSLGYVTGSLAGVYSWRTKNAAGESIPLPEFDTIPLDGRHVVLVWDSDAHGNPDVMHALRALRDELARRGANVEARIPPSADGAKFGVDDYLAAGGKYEDLPTLLLDRVTPLVSQAGDIDSDSFFLDIPPGIPAVWGEGAYVMWPEGEPFMITALEGLGKTTDALQLAFGLAGIPGFETLYGYPVRPLADGATVVFLALDRPNQIARAGARMIAPAQRDLVKQRVRIWKGALPFNIVANPDALLPWSQARKAGAVVFDSLKDIVPRLSDEEHAAAFMRAVGQCIAAGIQVLILHHNRKANAQNPKPKTLSDIHGSTNFTRGCGSVVCLWAEAAGATEVEASHVKPPAEPCGPFIIHRNHTTGRSTRERAGVLATDATSQRKAAILAHFREGGGTGIERTLKQLQGAGLVSENTLRKALGELVTEGRLSVDAGVGRGNETLWKMVPDALVWEVES